MTRDKSESLFFKEINQKQCLLAWLLQCVADGDQQKAEKILKIYPELLLQYGNVSDSSGRTFPHITAFQYALWALDVWHMCKMMLSCLPKTGEGDLIKCDLFRQFQELEHFKIHYYLRDKIYKEKYFNLSPLVSALQFYVDSYHQWSDDERANNWCTGVGLAQRELPVNLCQQYCNPDPPFIDLPFRETFIRTLQLENSSESDSYYWDKPIDGLGVYFAVIGSRHSNPAQTKSLASLLCAQEDLAALLTFYKVRKNDLILLKKFLSSYAQTQTSGLCVLL